MPLDGSISIPASDIMPPPVNDTGAIGTSTAYALADHTHVSSVYAQIVATTDNTGTVTWTYPPNFFKASPVIVLTVEDNSNQAFDAKITSNTIGGGSAKLIASSNLPNVSLSLLNYNVFGGNVPVGTKLHIIARRMTGT